MRRPSKFVIFRNDATYGQSCYLYHEVAYVQSIGIPKSMTLDDLERCYNVITHRIDPITDRLYVPNVKNSI